MPWTKEQQRVIDQRDADILVSAAAGSGKTAVLVERIIQKITDEEHPVDADKLLVVTFTKAAAAEMKERIAKALDQKVQEHPEKGHYVRQLALIQKAQITTVHSFCMNLIRDYFYVLGIDPNTKTGEESQLSILREQVLDEILEEAYEKREEGFVEFVESYSPGKNDQVISQYILKLYEIARSHVRPEQWLLEAKANISVKTLDDLFQTPFMKMILKDAYAVAKAAKMRIEEALELTDLEYGPYFYRTTLEKDLEIMQTFEEAESFDDFSIEYIGLKKPRLTGRKKKTDAIDGILQEKCKELRNQAYKLIEEIGAAYFYCQEGEILRELKVVKKPISALIDLVILFMERYTMRKQNENLMDFDDMEHYALDLLIDDFDKKGNPVPSDIAKEKSCGFEEIYIDEYQDSNFIQEAILKSVSGIVYGRHNMFMVGDVKQSIYGFRLARPDLFLEKYHDYQRKGEETKLIELRNNFRSRREVLTFVNDIFYEIMHETLGNIEYTDDVALVPTMEFPEGTDAQTEVMFLDEADVKELGEESSVMEAKMIARRIHEMVDGPEPMMVTDEDEHGNRVLRKAKYSDIVILLRSMKGNADVLQKELLDEGIPVTANSEKGYFDTVEIRTLLSMLAAADNVYLDIEMAAFLRSPMVGFTAEELGRLKAAGGEDHLYDCLKQVQNSMEKAQTAYRLLTKLREAKTYLSIDRLIWLALDESGYFHYAGSMPGGKKRQGNILMLIEQARAFENTQIKGLFHFVRYMEQCREYDMDFGEANVLGGREDLVHISSIHKSKGLEYPIVFIAKMHQKFNLRDGSGNIIFHPDYYIGAEIIDPVSRTKSPTILKSVIQRQMKKDSLGEELRVLYVAMTRAKEKLVLTGIIKSDVQWQRPGPVSSIDLLMANSYMHWVCLALPNIPKEDFRIGRFSMEDQTWLEGKEAVEAKLDEQIFIAKLFDKMSEEKQEHLRAAFSHKYAYRAETAGQLKYSVSEIKRMSQAADDEPEEMFLPVTEKERRIPKFMETEEKISPTSRGTAVHKIFELLDFSRTYSYQELDRQIHRWMKDGIINEEYDRVIYRKDILAFMESEFGERVRRAAKRNLVFKEKQFVIGVPFSKMHPESDTDARVVVQGIIDLYFREGEDLVLADYKTDRVNDLTILKDRYHEQLEYYKEALEQITGRKVKESWIYSAALRKFIMI